MFLLHWSASRAFAQAQPPPAPRAPAPHLSIPRVGTPTRLEDYLAGGSAPGLAVTGFLQRDPKDLAPATEPTTAYLAYDETNIYVAFVCRTSDVFSNPIVRSRVNYQFSREWSLPHPGTALYVGFTDGYDNLRIDPVNGVELTSHRLSMTGRQVFVKMSRLFRF